MNEIASCRKESVSKAIFAYAFLSIFALGFDLLTDRSFGALMLATLPIAMVALCCLVIGPWVRGGGQTRAKIGWAIGTILIFLISLAFASLGGDQAKTGELIFTYASILMSLPGSLALPFFETLFFTGNAFENVYVRIGSAWSVCFAIGCLEWSAVGLVRNIIHRRRVRR